MHGRFQLCDESNKVLGIVTSKDMIGVAKEHQLISNDKAPILQVNGKMSVAAAARMMVWEEIELLPVVEEEITARYY